MAKKKSAFSIFMISWLFLFGSALMLPTFTFIFVAMLPTIVAIAMDNAAKGYKWVCVMGLNLAGMMPYLFELWMGVHDMVAVIDMLLNVNTIIVIYGCSAIGWLLYVLVPPIIVSMISVADGHKVKKLKKRQEMLVKLWGEEVSLK